MANCSQPLADMSEFLREEQRDGEIAQQKNGENESDCRNRIDVHGLPQLLAGLDVEKRQGEENSGEQQHHDILHCKISQFHPDGTGDSLESGVRSVCPRHRAVGQSARPTNRPNRIDSVARLRLSIEKIF